ncbi:MAG: PspC domain-containing protein, partial [Alistipes sp.]|nr:PspC domain-containing protein [Alistipes sp.]
PRVNRSIAGVCSGIADYFDLDVTLIRLVTFLMIFLGSLSIWIYVILWIVIPEEPIREFNNNTK